MRKAGSVLLLAAAMTAPARAEVRSQGRVCGAIVVTSPDQPRARLSFSARKTLDLQFRMRLGSRDDDAHVVRFRVLTPKGRLYQEIKVAHQGTSGKKVASIAGRLPVAGTTIATSSLYGRWRVVPYFDDGTRPCTAAAVFTIVK